MQLNKLMVRDFRNYEYVEIDFDPGVNLIIGNNAQGKTNLLEAIGYLGSNWEYVTSGDFAGDGTDDIIVRNLSDGGLWVWDDADSSTAHWVGTPGEGFKVEAVGDYNGDGKEDLLLREYTTGWGGVGYWASADANQWTDLNARIETDLESKFTVIA